MPQFNFQERAPQGQVQASGPRDQGTGIQIQQQMQAAQGFQQLAAGVQDIAQQRVQEQAQSDMSAYQSERITREQKFREDSAKLTNPKELKKLSDKYIKDLNLYAEGKRPDGTEVFRNGMGKAEAKAFNQKYAAQFKAQVSQQAFELDRRRDRLNYQQGVNNGVKNNNSEAISMNIQAMVDQGHITPEEGTMQREQALTDMSVNYFKETQATMMIGVEESLNRINQEQIVFDGSGPKRPTDTYENVAQTTKQAFENYKAELYADKNLNEQQRAYFIDKSKAGLKSLEYRQKAQQDAFKLQQETNYNKAQLEYLAMSIANPGADDYKLQADIFGKYGKELQPKDQISMMSNLKKAQDRHILSQTNKAAEVEIRAEKEAVEDLIYDYSATGDPTGNRFIELMNRVESLKGHPAQARLRSFLSDQSPFNEKNHSPLGSFTRESMTRMKAELGLNLTEAEFKKLGSDRTAKPYEPWQPWLSHGFTQQEIDEHKDSVEKYFDFAPESMRTAYLNKIMRDAQDMFGKDQQKASLFIDTKINELKKSQNDYKFINSYLKTGKGATVGKNPYNMIRTR
jgi:hypothetical protein